MKIALGSAKKMRELFVSSFFLYTFVASNNTAMEYNFEHDEAQNRVKEPAVAYKWQGASQNEKADYLKKNLHPSTVEFLENMEFMENRPFPYDEPEEDWFDESDEKNPAMSNDVVMHDKEVWLNVI